LAEANFPRSMTNQKNYPDFWVAMRHQYMQFLCLFLTRHFAGKPVVVSGNVSCFLRLRKYVRGFVSKETVVLCWWGSKVLKVGFIN